MEYRYFKTIVFLFTVLLFFGTGCNKDEEPQIVSITAKDFDVTIDENPRGAQELGTIEAEASNGSTLSYTISKESVVGALSVNSNGMLSVNDSSLFDFEMRTEITALYKVVVGQVEDSAAITVNLNDLDDAPTLTANSFETTMDENPSNGTIIGTVVSTISDGSSLSYSLISSGNLENAANRAIAINSNNGELSVIDSSYFDYEKRTTITTDYRVSNGEISQEAGISITINDVQESGITAEDFAVSIAENPSNGDLIGTVNANYSDGNSLVYSITSQSVEGAIDFRNSSSGELVVADVSAFDFEVNQQITAVYEVTDGDLTENADISITITDVDEESGRQITANDFNVTVEENPDNGFVLGTLSASITDNSALSFSFETESQPGALSINTSSGVLAVANPGLFDYETNTEITATYRVVSASEGVQASASANISINITNVEETSWRTVGNEGFSQGGSSFVDIAFNTATPVVAFRNNANNSLQLMSFNGTQWVNKGPAASSGQADYVDLVIRNGQEVVAYRDFANGEKLTIKSFDGSNWSSLGSEGFSAGKAGYPRMAVDGNGKLYVVYFDESLTNTIIVKVFNSSNNTWDNVGSGTISTGPGYNPDIAINPNTNWPYVVFQDGGGGPGVVKRFDNTNSWVNVGSGIPNASLSRIDFDNTGQPYVASRDGNQTNRLSVRGFDGTNWILYGNAGISDGLPNEIDLELGSTGPIVSFRDSSNGNGISSGSDGATVMRWTGTEWEILGTKGFGKVLYPSLAQLNGKLYLAFSDSNNALKVTVKELVEE